jgi:hypothetical protein
MEAALTFFNKYLGPERTLRTSAITNWSVLKYDLYGNNPEDQKTWPAGSLAVYSSCISINVLHEQNI